MNSDLQLENMDMFTNAEILSLEDIGPRGKVDWSELQINIDNVKKNHRTEMSNPLSHKNAVIHSLIQSPNLASSAFGTSN